MKGRPMALMALTVASGVVMGFACGWWLRMRQYQHTLEMTYWRLTDQRPPYDWAKEEEA